MNAVDLRRLAERAEGIEGRQGARLTELHGRIRTARRRRTAVGTAAAAGLAVALVSGGVVLNGSIDRTDPPVDEPAGAEAHQDRRRPRHRNRRGRPRFRPRSGRTTSRAGS